MADHIYIYAGSEVSTYGNIYQVWDHGLAMHWHAIEEVEGMLPY